MNTLDKIISELLVRGVDDWIHITEVISVVRSHFDVADFARINEVSLQAISMMLDAGLVTVGDLIGSGNDIEFHAWSLKSDAAIARFAEELTRSRGWPNLSGEYWLSNTQKGDESTSPK